MLVNINNLINLVSPRVKQHIFTKFKDESITLHIRFEELLKFLYISSKYPQLKKTFIPLTKEVDDIWHELILQTAYYQKLCEALPGGKMIHHESLSFHDYQTNIPKNELIHEMLQWISLYVKNFGDFTEERIYFWFFINKIKETLNLSISELNNYARVEL
jgi:hypothetical protein